MSGSDVRFGRRGGHNVDHAPGQPLADIIDLRERMGGSLLPPPPAADPQLSLFGEDEPA